MENSRLLCRQLFEDNAHLTRQWFLVLAAVKLSGRGGRMEAEDLNCSELISAGVVDVAIDEGTFGRSFSLSAREKQCCGEGDCVSSILSTAISLAGFSKARQYRGPISYQWPNTPNLENHWIFPPFFVKKNTKDLLRFDKEIKKKKSFLYKFF